MVDHGIPWSSDHHFHLGQDPVQAKICMISYETVSKECFTNGNAK